MVDDYRGGIPYHVNACIKAFTIAPNFRECAQVSRSISGITVETFTPAQTTSISSTIPSSPSRTARLALNTGANADVSVYLVDKSRTYEERLDSEGYPKGRTGPIEWVSVPVYEAGYKPNFFWNDAGINYPVYGPFSLITDDNGEIVIDPSSLEYPDGSRASLPQSWYTAFCEISTGTTREAGVFYLTASTASDNDSHSSGGNESSNGGGGGGGCSAGMASLLVMAVPAFSVCRKRFHH